MRSLKPYWHETARTLRASGCTFPEVAAAVGRSVSAVKFMLHPEWKRRTAAPRPAKRIWTAEDRLRARLRMAAREEARATGETVEAVYHRFGVPSKDWARVWDARVSSTSRQNQGQHAEQR